MYRTIWKECHSSVCSIHFLSKAGTRIITFTGFRIRDYLITDDIIDKFTQPAKVYLRFTKEDGYTERAGKAMSYTAFKERIFHPGGKIVPGYVIIRLKDNEFKNIPSLKCSRKVDYEIGHPVAVLGYQLDKDNLAIKKGIISSFFTEQNSINYIQVDASIKQGNAGSPVIETENMEVIGVIGHHLASITHSYRRLMKIFNKNLSILKEVQGKYCFEELDPVQVLIANQNQIKHIATEFFKTANMRVGFASELCNLIDYCPDLDATMDLEVKQDG
ncbi:MAG: hypothetical protein AMS27_12245 [Bacteroides sp. SM23_62_1]|nr:MAG: hypothetical protein AMS27_12245 [Bacteroides sp. SM23_62_1]